MRPRTSTCVSAKAGIETKIVHVASIASAAAGLLGLQSYKFGPSATVSFSDNLSTRPYEVLADNQKHGWHTMLFLDLREGEGAMTAPEAIQVLSGLEERLSGGVFTFDLLLVGI